jgi:hypothetical protein
MRRLSIAHSFVEYMPSDLQDGTIYISVRFATAVHLCCCGCGNKVITPLSPVDWKLTFDGETVSLDPSVGNWSFPCESHYWIRHDRVQWAAQWSRARVDENRRAGRARKEMQAERLAQDPAPADLSPASTSAPRPRSWLRRIFSR